MRLLHTLLYLIFSANISWAVEFTVDVGDFSGTYHIDDGLFEPNHTYDLEPGRHLFRVAPGLGFFFDLAPDGTVTPENGDAAEAQTGSGGIENILSLITQEVQINRGNYLGQYELVDERIFPNVSETSGVRRYHLIPALGRYSIKIAPSNAFFFTLEADDRVIPERPETSVGSLRSLTFNTVDVHVNHGQFGGVWRVSGVEATAASGYRDVTIIPATDGYIFEFAPGTAFRFDVRADGSVDTSNTFAASETLTGMVLNTTPVTVTPENPLVPWFIRGLDPRSGSAGERTVLLPPDVAGWILQIGLDGNTRFSVDQAGIPVPNLRRIFVDGHYETFLLSGAGRPVSCNFTAEVTLHGDVSAALPSGSIIDLDATLVVDETDLNPDVPDFGFYGWTGLVNLNDRQGGLLVADTGTSLIIPGTSQDEISLYLTNPRGRLGGVTWDETDDVYFVLSGPSGTLVDENFERNLENWNLLTERGGIWSGFGSLIQVELGDFAFRPPGCG